MTLNCPIKSHESFSLTRALLNETQGWHSSSSTGSLGARAVNIVTLGTATLDAIAHLALGILTLGGMSQVGWLCNSIAYLTDSKWRCPLTFSGGLINICQGLIHTISIVMSPCLGVTNPELAAHFFSSFTNYNELSKSILDSHEQNHKLLEEIKMLRNENEELKLKNEEFELMSEHLRNSFSTKNNFKSKNPHWYKK